jgi:hypothetical protein
MTDKKSWNSVEIYVKKQTSVHIKASDDVWHVDRFPAIQTKSVKISYGELKVVKRYGKK